MAPSASASAAPTRRRECNAAATSPIMITVRCVGTDQPASAPYRALRRCRR